MLVNCKPRYLEVSTDIMLRFVEHFLYFVIFLRNVPLLNCKVFDFIKNSERGF